MSLFLWTKNGKKGKKEKGSLQQLQQEQDPAEAAAFFQSCSTSVREG
jgi:hypothetical protein